MAFDTGTRRHIAQGWASSSLDQESYAASHGISPRTLREWVRLYSAGDRPVARARAIIENSIAQLQALSAALDAEEACQVGTERAAQEAVSVQPERHAEPPSLPRKVPPSAGPAPVEDVPKRHAEPVVKLTAAPAAPAESVMRPMRRGGYFASMNEEP